MNRLSRFLMIGCLLALPQLGAAQFSESYNFLKAVKDRDGTEVTKIVSKPGSIVIDTHDGSTGETALHIVTKDRDTTWMHFLLSKGAKPDARDKDGETPLLIAARLNYNEGADLLLAYHAGVDVTNSAGETPLIRAVQLGNTALVKILLSLGANPEKPDHIAGLSARDYAKRNTRNAEMLKVLEATTTAKPKSMQGPSL